MKTRTGSATTSGGSATLENSRSTIPLGNFATVCEKFWKKFAAQSGSAHNDSKLTVSGAIIRSVRNCLNIDIPRVNSGRSDEGIELRCLGLLKKEGGCRASNERG